MQARVLVAFSILLCGCLALAGCARSAEQTPTTSPPKENAMTERPSATQAGAEAATTDEGPLVDAQVGPHRFRIPAHYFDNQMGPEFDGSFGLFLEWPRLEPFPAGARSSLKLETSLKQIAISLGYVEKLDMSTLLERYIAPLAGHEAFPDENISLRIKGNPAFGLVPYYADFSKIFPHYRSLYGEGKMPVMEKDNHEDWYFEYSDAGRIQSLLKCTSREVSGDGVTVIDGRVARDDSDSLPMCTHYFVLENERIDVKLSYLRAYLKDWKRIETRTRSLIQEQRMNTPAHEQI